MMNEVIYGAIIGLYATLWLLIGTFIGYYFNKIERRNRKWNQK